VTFAVTGANGFLGVYIIHHLLNQGHHVFGIIRPSSLLSQFNLVSKFLEIDEQVLNNLTWKRCELFDDEELENIFNDSDYVIHLAGTISYLKKDLPKLLETNRDYTALVVNVALRTSIKKLLFCSSTSAISKNNTNQIVIESKDWDNKVEHSKYGYTKHLGELEIWRGIEEGLDAVIINPGVILGYGNWNYGSNRLFRNAYREFPFYSEGVTGFVGVKDVAEIAVNLCVSEFNSEQYLVVSENFSYNQISQMMAKHFNSKPPKIGVNGWVYKLIYGLIGLKEFFGFGGLLTRETVRASIAKNRFSNQKVINALNFEFTTIDDVLKEAITGYKKSPPK
jgi:dihydroflavonol-4-reductase